MGAHRTDLAELKRLYEDEKLTLAEVGKRVGVSRQWVHYRLTTAGVKMRSTKKTFPRELLVQLCVVERLPVIKVAARLNSHSKTVAREMRRLGIPVPEKGPRRRTKSS